MAAFTMYTYLSAVTADYTTATLTLTPNTELTETPKLNQEVMYDDDGNQVILSLSDNIVFEMSTALDNIDEDDMGDIFDFYCDSTKANGKEKSFYLAHPTDTYTYTVKFMNDIGFKRFNIPNASIDNITFLVLGRHP